jgi:hypothetical protein
MNDPSAVRENAAGRNRQNPLELEMAEMPDLAIAGCSLLPLWFRL